MHDVIGIGLGPFNLGLAALLEPVEDVDAVFLEARDDVAWHPGMLLPDSRLQTPFMSDLVTMADPTSRHSFLAFLKETGRLYPFYIRESFYPLRREFDAYLRWVANRLDGIRLSTRVTSVTFDEGSRGWVVAATTPQGEQRYAARSLVVGTGTTPYVPTGCAGLPADAHNSTYLRRRESLLDRRRVVVVGSGQSAAEVVRDLLTVDDGRDREVVWVTRSARFFPLELTKLTLELTSPDYIDHVHGLPQSRRDALVGSQAPLYKGISADLVDEIYELLYARGIDGRPRVRMLTGTEVVDSSTGADGVHRMTLRHNETGEERVLEADGVVLGTGYRHEVPAFLAPVADRIRWDERGRFDVKRDYRVDVDGPPIWVQNAELHTHGFAAPDLGMAAHRNSWIIRGLTGREVYPIETRIAHQEFGLPEIPALDAVEEVSA
ncbi:lysine N(6)-hydroxylase/L-ornithine N(5)-oxygenase family protein [Knoellia remsis]|nr:SidA/IucD/PvdA family monooxygenase [Knoellia remsis]